MLATRNCQTRIVIRKDADYGQIFHYLNSFKISRVFIVCGKSFDNLPINDELTKILKLLNIHAVFFRDFSSNPKYIEIEAGTNAFLCSGCNVILSVGGGSAVDVAKCIKLFSRFKDEVSVNENFYSAYLSKKNFASESILGDDKLPLIAIPTTSGTGSESTDFAVFYFDNKKISVEHDLILPNLYIIDSSSLSTLPLYQKKVTMLDALSHAMESIWSVNSTRVSQRYAKLAIKLILGSVEHYLKGDDQANYNMLVAANYAGKAINISKTTAGHALSYKLTSLYGIPHGYATALCNIGVYDYLIKNIRNESLLNDPRGLETVEHALQIITREFDCFSLDEALTKYKSFVTNLNLDKITIKNDDLEVLADSVNLERLSNNPLRLNRQDIIEIYKAINFY